MILSKSETALVSFALGLIVLAIYQLWLPINYHHSDQMILGELNFLENSTKLKMSGDLVWRDAQRGDPVSQGSSVFTGDNARVLVNMNSGSEIQLGSNTLIRIDEKVQLKNGILSTRLGSESLRLNISGVDYNLQGEGAQVQLSQNDVSTTLSVVEGSVRIQGDKEDFEIKKDEGLEISEKSSKKVEYAISLVAPSSSQVFWTRQDFNVQFEWTTPKALIEISQDLNFKNTLVSEKLETNNFSYRLSAGQYYWRVSSSVGISRVGQFSIFEEKPISLSQPSNSTVLEIPSANQSLQHRFQWTDLNLKSFELELEFNQVTKKYSAPQNDLVLNLSEAGLYRWRVLPQDPLRPQAIASEWGSFEVVKQQVLVSPVWKIDFLEISKKSDDESIDVSFEAKGIEHEWEIRLDDKKILSQRTHLKALSFPGGLDAGEYVWIVRTFNRFGEASEWSKPLIVKWKPLIERAPIEGQEIQLDRPDQKVSFEWTGEGEHYFELASDESFSQVIISRKAKDKTEIVFPEVGTYFWRVRKSDGSYSAPRKVKVEPSPPLEAPEAPPELQKEIKLEFPKTQKSSSWFDLIIPRAFASELKGKLTINLPENEKAEGYKLEVYTDEGLSKLIFSKVSANSEVEWDGALPGEYYYRYALIDAWGRESEMSPASVLKIVPGQISPPGRAKLIRPIRAQVVRKTPSISFSWTASERSQQYLFQLAKDTDFKTVLSEQMTNVNQLMFEPKDLEFGEMYFWRVIAKHSYGETPSSVGRFIYDSKNEVPKAEETKVVEPSRAAKRPLGAFSYLLLGWSPQKLSTKIDEKEFNAQIDGNILNSLQLESRTYFSKTWGLEFGIQNQSGKVFNSQDFLYRSLHLGGIYSLGNESSLYHYSLGVNQTSFSRFRLLSPESVVAKTDSGMGARGSFEWEYRYHPEYSLQTGLSAIVGDVTLIDVNLQFRRFIRAKTFIQMGLDFSQQQIKTKTGKNTSTLMGLSIGAGLSF